MVIVHSGNECTLGTDVNAAGPDGITPAMVAVRVVQPSQQCEQQHFAQLISQGAQLKARTDHKRWLRYILVDTY